jgi:hypothetical protein
MREEPNRVTALKNPAACDAPRVRRLEISRIALLLVQGLGLRRCPLVLGLLNAQRYETNDAR